MDPVSSNVNRYSPTGDLDHLLDSRGSSFSGSVVSEDDRDLFADVFVGAIESFPALFSWTAAAPRDADGEDIDPSTRLERARNETLFTIDISKQKIEKESLKAHESWKVNLIQRAAEARPAQVVEGQVSPAPEILLNPTDVELQTLSHSFSNWAVIGLIHNFSILGGSFSKGIEFSEVSGMIGKARNSEDPEREALEMYIDRCAEKMQWGPFQKMVRKTWMKCSYWMLNAAASEIMHKVFQNVLKDLRSGMDEKDVFEARFEGGLKHLEAFLAEYNSSEVAAAEPDVQPICDKIASFLIHKFFPKELSLCEDRFKGVPLLRFLWKAIDSSLNGWILYGVKRSLPSLLKKAVDAFENSITGKAPINYRLAKPILEFMNSQLDAWLVTLKKPPRETSEPAPLEVKEKLKGVIQQVIALARGLSGNKKIEEQLPGQLTDAVYQLMKFCYREKESLLQKSLKVAGSSLFSENHGVVSDPEADQRTYEGLRSHQGVVIDQISVRLIDLIATKLVDGVPATQTNHHWHKEHGKIKHYLVFGSEDLSKDLENAKHALSQLEYGQCSAALDKHLIFWEGFCSLVAEATKQHYPPKAREKLIKEFGPLYVDAEKQVKRVSALRDQYGPCISNKNLKELFTKLRELMNHTSLEDLQEPVQALLSQIRQQFTFEADEVHLISAYIELLPFIQKEEKLLRDLESKQDLLVQRANGSVSEEERLEIQSIHLLIQSKTAALREYHSSLWSRIDPTDPNRSHNFDSQLGAFKEWISQQTIEYERLEKESRTALLTGLFALSREHRDLLAKVQRMQSKDISVDPSDSSDHDERSWTDLGLSVVRNVAKKAVNFGGDLLFKKDLIHDFKAVLNGVIPLIIGTQGQGAAEVLPDEESSTDEPVITKKNLYVWGGRLALGELLSYCEKEAEQRSSL